MPPRSPQSTASSGARQDAGIIRRDAVARPHRFRAATDEPLHGPLATLLRRSVGVEEQLRTALAVPGVLAAVVHGSWASGTRRPDSDIDVLAVGDADLRERRRLVAQGPPSSEVLDELREDRI